VLDHVGNLDLFWLGIPGSVFLTGPRRYDLPVLGSVGYRDQLVSQNLSLILLG
jgi:hypothetical protein